ncbi:hypothetical protein HMPREF1141_3202 [Clostridium sp. MSTE9]|nr:hypothetical protein HMPREF1141_3202 [Clostridium sp. MSTE9]
MEGLCLLSPFHERECPPRHEGQALRQQYFLVRQLTEKSLFHTKIKKKYYPCGEAKLKDFSF